MPWQTLELDRDTATVKDVKRSYAKRLKITRPDQDPEGFRKLHEAYSSALEQLEWRDASGTIPFALPPEEASSIPQSAPLTDSAPAPSSTVPLPGGFPLYQEPATETAPEQLPFSDTPPPMPATASLPLSPALKAITSAIDNLESALKQGDETVAELVREVEKILYEQPGEARRWGELMAELIHRYSSHPELRLKSEALLFELENDGCDATLAIIMRMENQGRSGGISGLAKFLLEHKARIATTAGAIAMARLACGASIWDRSLIDPLSNFAYEHFDRGDRDQAMHVIFQYQQLAEVVRQVPDRWKFFWIRRLLAPKGEQFDWSAEESREALLHLNSPRGRMWFCYPMLKQLVPKQRAPKFQSGTIPPPRSGRPLGNGYYDEPNWNQTLESDLPPSTPRNVPTSNTSAPLPLRPAIQPEHSARKSRNPESDQTPEWDRVSPSHIPSRRQPSSHSSSRAPYRAERSSSIPVWGIVTAVILVLKIIFFAMRH